MDRRIAALLKTATAKFNSGNNYKMVKRYSNFKVMFVLFFVAFMACKKDSTEELTEAEQIDNSESTVSEVSATNSEDHERSDDYIWETSAVIPVVLNGSSITASTVGMTVNGSKLTITAAGTYSFSGSLTDGQIIVNTEDEATVRLILNSVDIKCLASAPIYIKSAKKVVLVLPERTSSKLTDGTAYTYDVPADEEPSATIFSKSDLTIFGDGSLTVSANFNDGITSKDGLIVKSGTIAVTSADDGIAGKDYLVVKGGTITVKASGDGLKSSNDTDEGKGFISVETGTISVTSSGDAMAAKTDILIKGGSFNLVSGGGSSKSASSTVSSKGIKSGVSIIIDSGDFTVSSADDAIHSNGSIALNGGTFTLASGDDGIHSDAAIGISGADINLTKSYEGIEGPFITINKGNVYITASDDGFNASKGLTNGGGESNDGSCLTINDGYVVVTVSGGDGLDSNGNIVMSGGTMLVHGPQSNPEVGMDYNGTFNVSGGTLVISGTNSNMTQGASTSSTQYSVKIISGSSLSTSTLFHIQDSSGNDILTFKPARSYYSIVFSSASLKNGSTYDIYTGGTSTGTFTDGLYTGGTYSGGTKYTSFTISGMVTSVGTASGGMGGR
ncbi:MAG: carbohydrate-binding domain-containing protein [Prolixibacteraceae bacterium]